MYQPVAMVDQDGKRVKMDELAAASHQQQLQQAFLSEIRSFDEENNRNSGKGKRPRTSDADFNKEKTNLIVNYLPQVKNNERDI